MKILQEQEVTENVVSLNLNNILSISHPNRLNTEN